MSSGPQLPHLRIECKRTMISSDLPWGHDGWLDQHQHPQCSHYTHGHTGSHSHTCTRMLAPMCLYTCTYSFPHAPYHTQHTHICAHTNTGRDVNTHTRSHTAFHAHATSTHMCSCTHTHTPLHALSHMCTHSPPQHAHSRICTHTHMLSHVHTHVHTHYHAHPHIYTHRSECPIIHTSFPNFQKAGTDQSGKENKNHLARFYAILMISQPRV